MLSIGYYCRTLNYGGAAVERCMHILDFWKPGMTSAELLVRVLSEGRDSAITASSVKHAVTEIFRTRFLSPDALPWTEMLAQCRKDLSARAIEQICFLLTARAEAMLEDFLSMEYWPRVARAEEEISKETLQAFLSIAAAEGRGGGRWTESRLRRAVSSLSAALSGFHLIERESRANNGWRMTPPILLNEVLLCLLYDFKGRGLHYEEILSHPDWDIFGLGPGKVRSRLADPAFARYFEITESLSAVSIQWKFKNIEDVVKDYVAR